MPVQHQYKEERQSASDLDSILERIRATPDRLAELSFFAANLIRDEGLDYYRTMNRLIGAALARGATEGSARWCVYRGFACSAAGHADPTATLVSMRPEYHQGAA